MTVIVFIACLALGVLVHRLFGRVRALEQEVAELRERGVAVPREAFVAPPATSPAVSQDPPVVAPPAPAPPPPFAPAHAAAAVRREAVIVRTLEPVAETETLPSEPGVPPPPPPSAPTHEPVRIGFEAIVGGKLPIWIGGAALVLAAFFLVRYSIESGLLGPAARTVIATLFGFALVAASEAARRLPATREDARIGQALAGAGIAVLYGALYVGAAVYDLIGAGTAFVLMIAITLAALALALRHGPPTAIMALVGGFSAPLIAGFDEGGIGPLLVYLALLVAALFGLAIRRGWTWLALAACGGGFAWVNILIGVVGGDALAGVGGFVLLLAIGATLALPRTGTSQRWLRLLPLLAGLVQLLVLAPSLDFGPISWGLYLVLSAAALWLGWRDPALAPGAAAALTLVLLLLGVALSEDSTSAPVAALVITTLFAAPGHLRARTDPLWAGIALGGTAGPVLLAVALRAPLLPPALWAVLLWIAAAALGWLAWRSRDRASQTLQPTPELTGATALAALLAAVGWAELVPGPWRWLGWLVIALALALWARRIGDETINRLAGLPVAIVAVAALADLDRLLPYLNSVFGPAARPPLLDLLALGILPALLIGATALLIDALRLRRTLGWVALVLALSVFPAALPQPWHSASLGAATALLILFRPPLPGAAAGAGIATLAFSTPLLTQLLQVAVDSLLGDRLPYLMLPPLASVLRELTLPAALVGAALYRRLDRGGPWCARAVAVLSGIAGVTLYTLAKLPLAIDTPQRFVEWGLLERALITQALFAAAFVVRTRHAQIAQALLSLALARLIWFDLLLLNPLVVPQSVGTWPILNLAVLHLALAAAWLWPNRTDRRWHIAMLALTALAVAAAVRQATHGALLDGGIGRTENWLYSAAFLALSLLWLWRGITRGKGDLRVAGLGLLTAVTLKVFLIDAAALSGLLRILSFLGLGLALIAIGWAYGRVIARDQKRSI